MPSTLKLNDPTYEFMQTHSKKFCPLGEPIVPYICHLLGPSMRQLNAQWSAMTPSKGQHASSRVVKVFADHGANFTANIGQKLGQQHNKL